MASFGYLLPPTSRINFTDLQKFIAFCSPYCCCYNKPTSFTAAPAAYSLRLGFEFPFEKPRKKDNILRTLAVRQLTGSLTSAEGLRFAIVVARFNEIVTKPLLEGTLKTFGQYSVEEEDIDVVWVPGSLKLAWLLRNLENHKNTKQSCVLELCRFEVIPPTMILWLILLLLEYYHLV